MNNKIIVAGASSGIGLATARALTQSGASVTITGRNASKLEAAGLPYARVDCSSRSELDAFFPSHGLFDHLVVCIGSGKGFGPFAGIALADLRRGFEEKFWAVLNTVQAALAYLRSSVTVVTAISATGRMPGTSGLAAVNGALETMIPIWAKEMAPLRFNAVSPGVIDTPWWDFLLPAEKEVAFARYATQIPLGRVGTPQDVAEAIEFLVSSTYITGKVIACDGGLG